MNKLPHLISVLLFLSISCTKSSKPHQFTASENLSKSTPVVGLVITPTTYTMDDMLADSDLSVESDNRKMNIVALAFQQIACDEGFDAAIGNALDDDREFDVRVFLSNNPVYESTIQSWMQSNGHDYNSVFGVNSIVGPWGYACNFGVHDSGPPILAVSVDLDTTVLGELDDFVPCYYATENCDDYQVGLLGLESDLDPESPGNPIRDLAIIFEAGSDITNKTVIDLGVEADYAGTLITQGGTPPNCEKGDHYNLEHFKITQKYNKGKNLKIRLRVSVSFANVNFTPTDLCLLYAENQKQKCLKGNHQDLVGSFSPPKSFEGRTIVTTVVTTPKSTKESNHWGMLFESDWYSIKKHHSIYATSCNTNMLLKGRMKNHNELYAAFYFLGDWCNGDTYRFINQPGHGDQNSWVDIQNSSSYNLNEY